MNVCAQVAVGIRQWLKVLLLLAACLDSPLNALDAEWAISQYAKKHWQVEQGLPRNYVTSIAQAPDGRLLVGTSGGVARFDGIGFEPVILDQASGLSQEWINAVSVTPDGDLWIASRDAGLFLEKDGAGARQVIAGEGSFSSLLTRKDGSVLGFGSGLWHLREGDAVRLAPIATSDLNWQRVVELEDGRVLAAGADGVFEYGGGNLRLLHQFGLSSGGALSLALGAQGSVYIGTHTGIYRMRLQGRPAVSLLANIPGPVVNVLEDRDGVVWVATWGQGLFRIAGEKLDRWTTSDGLADDFVHSLFEDSEGSLWIASRAGLSRWRSGPIVPHGPPEGLDAQFISAVTGVHSGELIVGTWRKGLFRRRDGRFHREGLGGEESTTLVRSLAPEPTGGFWFSEFAGQVTHIGRDGRKTYTEARLGHPASANAIQVDRRGGLWLGTASGLFEYPAGRPEGPPRRHLMGKFVRCLAGNSAGELWVGTRSGLYRLDGGGPKSVSGLPHQDVTSLYQDARGRLWAATRVNGIALIVGQDARVLDHRHGLPPLPVHAMVEDLAGSLWFSTPAGLYRLDARQLEAWIGGSRQEVEPVPFTGEDGLRSIEFQNVGTPSAWRDAAGHLWFPTTLGLVEVRPQGVRPVQPPRVTIRSVDSRSRAHEVHFSASRLSGAHRVEFRYRVIGVRDDWLSLGRQRVLRFDNLPSGEHRLLLEAREIGGKWGEPAIVTLQQTPRWYETWWARVTSGAFIVCLCWFLYRWRVSLVRRRYALVAVERSRIGREWHDTLLAGFSAISWQLQSALERLPGQPAKAGEAIRGALDMLRHYRTEARRVIWDLRHQGPEHEPLTRAVERSLADIIQNRSIAKRLRIEGEPIEVSGEINLNLLRICQEAVMNAVKHASPSAIEVRLVFLPGRVRASIQDDGGGFDPDVRTEGHFGLEIMRERAAHFGGTLTIESQPGFGTRVEVDIPHAEVLRS